MEIYDFKTGKPVAISVPVPTAAAEGPELKPEKVLVDVLEQLLKLAKEGQLRSIAFTSLTASGLQLRGYTVPDGAELYDYYAQYGAIMAVGQAYYLANIMPASHGGST